MKLDGYVYFVEAKHSKKIKIGFAKTSPLKRMTELQTGSPEPLRLLFAFPASRDMEGMLHRRFSSCRTGGEWFGPKVRLQNFLKQLGEFAQYGTWPPESPTREELRPAARFFAFIASDYVEGIDYPSDDPNNKWPSLPARYDPEQEDAA